MQSSPPFPLQPLLFWRGTRAGTRRPPLSTLPSFSFPSSFWGRQTTSCASGWLTLENSSPPAHTEGPRVARMRRGGGTRERVMHQLWVFDQSCVAAASLLPPTDPRPRIASTRNDLSPRATIFDAVCFQHDDCCACLHVKRLDG